MVKHLLLLGLLFTASVIPAQMRHVDGHWPAPEVLADWARGGESGGEFNSEEAYTEANRLIIEENWREAEVLLKQLFESDPDNRNFAYKWALCLKAIPGRIEEAVPLVHLAVDGPFADRYNAFSVKQELPPEEALTMGLEVLQDAYHFAEAQGLASIVLTQYPKRDYRHQRAVRVMEECDFAMRCIQEPVDVEIVPEHALNSNSADYAPVLSPDGQTLYFTSHRTVGGRFRGEGRIYRSKRTSDGWSRPVRMEIGTVGREMTTVAVLGDEDALLAYQEFRGEGGIWKLERDEAGGWTREEKLGYPVDSRHWETFVTERFDGKERVFVSDRPGGQGGRDLYRTVKLPDGTWSEPLNLGRRINSPGEEESPVISSDGQTLIFASNGLPGMGGFDLFRCRRLDNGSWSDPEHLGHPLNTPGDEAILTLDASGMSGYISSARAGGDDLDIYRVNFREEPGEELAVMLGEVLQWKAGDVMEVRATDDGPALFRVFRARDEGGKFVAALPPCRQYNFRWMRRGEALLERTETIGCGDAYGASGEVFRLAPFTLDVMVPEEMESPLPAAIENVDGIESTEMVKASVGLDAPKAAEVAETADVMGTTATQAKANAVVDAAPGEGGALNLIEFEAVQSKVEFGYGRYVTGERNAQVMTMARSIAERNRAGDVPVIEIEGAASFVPVKNKRAYETNEQLARMRAEHARDALITELARMGLQVGVDYQIVLEWGVAGPQYQGDAVTAADKYRTYQYAQFSLARSLVEQRY